MLNLFSCIRFCTVPDEYAGIRVGAMEFAEYCDERASMIVGRGVRGNGSFKFLYMGLENSIG